MMKFTTAVASIECHSVDTFELLQATESLNQAYMDLTEAQHGMDEVCTIMENIHTSVDLINKFGKNAIPILNVDGGLEALLQIPENVITAEKAMEGLGEAAKDLGTKFIEKCKQFFTAVINWFTKAISFFKTDVDGLREAVSNLEDALNQTASIKNIDKKIADVAQKEASSEGLQSLESNQAEYFKYKVLFPKALYESLVRHIKFGGFTLTGSFKDVTTMVSECKNWTDDVLNDATAREKQNPNILEEYNTIIRAKYKGEIRPYDAGFRSHSDIKECLRPTGEVIDVAGTALKMCRSDLEIFRKNLTTVSSLTGISSQVQRYLMALYKCQISLTHQKIIVLKTTIRIFKFMNEQLTNLLQHAAKSVD